MGNVKLRSVFGIFLIVAAASLTALAGCAPLRLQPAARRPPTGRESECRRGAAWGHQRHEPGRSG